MNGAGVLYLAMAVAVVTWAITFYGCRESQRAHAKPGEGAPQVVTGQVPVLQVSHYGGQPITPWQMHALEHVVAQQVGLVAQQMHADAMEQIRAQVSAREAEQLDSTLERILGGDR